MKTGNQPITHEDVRDMNPGFMATSNGLNRQSLRRMMKSKYSINNRKLTKGRKSHRNMMNGRVLN